MSAEARPDISDEQLVGLAAAGDRFACDWRRKFGAGFSAVVAALREKLAAPEPLQRRQAGKLRSALEARL